MKKIGILILNYKTWELTIQFIEHIKKNVVLSKDEIDIIVVDNNSPNDSAEQLMSKSKDLGYIFIKSEENKGYASGNNIGMKYMEKCNYDYALIVNNDIIFNDVDIINKLLIPFNENKKIAIASPDVFLPGGYLCNRDLKRPSIYDMTLGGYKYKKLGRETNAEKWDYSYRPQGCCMLVDLKKMKEIDYMDEYTFLYCEEIILAERLIDKGYKCVCCINTSIIHNHSYTVKSSLSKIKFIKCNIHSFNYYMKKYRKYNIFQRLWCNAFMVLKLILTKQV